MDRGVLAHWCCTNVNMTTDQGGGQAVDKMLAGDGGFTSRRRRFGVAILPRRGGPARCGGGRRRSAGMAAAAADHRDFFFEGGQPVGQVEAGAGRLAGPGWRFLVGARRTASWLQVPAAAMAGPTRARTRSIASGRVNRSPSRSATLGRRTPYCVAQLFEAGQVGVGRFGGPVGKRLLPQFGGGGAVLADEDFVGHHDGPQVPGDAIVVGPQAQEIDQRVEQLAVVGVGGRGVVVAVLAIVFDDRFERDREPLGGLVARDVFVELGDQADVLRLGFLFQIRQPDGDALMQDGPQVAEVEKLLREQVGAVALDERDERVPFVFGR